MVAGSLLPLIGLSITHQIIFWVAVGLAGAAILLETCRFTFPNLNRVLFTYFGVLFKEKERQSITAATYMLIASVGAFLFLEKSLAILSLLFLSVGDSSAALVGSRYGRARFFGKSLEGSLVLFAISALIGWLFLLTGQVSPYWPILVGAAVAATVELLPLPLDDNLTIPLFAGATMAALL